jgi:DNA primase
LVHFPYEESEHWKRELSQSTGYQKSLFQQDYRAFLDTLRPENEEDLMRFLKMQKDTTNEEVESAINYLKLRKIKRLLLQNQVDIEKAEPSQMEIELSKKLGSVVIK